jgi:hypothetical protein
MSALIFLNTFVMAAEAQMHGMQVAREFGYDHVEGVVNSDSQSIFETFGWIFGVSFALEMIVRLAALKLEYLMDPLSWIDVVSVVFWLVEQIDSSIFSFNTMMIRIVRLVRLMRFVRIVRFVNAFQKLYLLVQSIKSSFSALIWSSAVLFLLEFILALAVNISLSGYFADTDAPFSEREPLFEYFGTFTKSLLSQFEMLLGNWYTITRLLVSHSEAWAIYGLIHQLVLGFAVIEVITGVFLRETFQVAALDDGIMTAEQKREISMNTEKLTEFFDMADSNANGLLSKRELTKVLQRTKVQQWLAALGLEIGDVQSSFHIFDSDGDGEISAEEFVAGALALKGPAKATELAKLTKKLDLLCAHLRLH